MKKLFTILILLLSINGYSQNVITDAKGDILFGVPLSKIQGQVSLSKLEIGTQLGRFGAIKYYMPDYEKYTGSKKDTLFTMVKSFLPFVKVGVISNTESVLKLKGKLNLSPTVEAGISHGFDSLLGPSFKEFTYWTISVSYLGKWQGFDFYDTISKTFVGKTNRWSSGVKVFSTVFFKTIMAVSLSGSWEKSIVTDDLTAYQKRSNTFYSDNNVANTGKKDGYFTPVNPTNNYRFSLSIPYFLGRKKPKGKLSEKYPLVIAPYYFGIFSDAHLPNHNVGITLSFLESKFRNFDSEFDENGNRKRKKNNGYTFKEALTFGLNLISTNQKDPVYIFISGTFDIGKFKFWNETAKSTPLK